MNGREEQAFCWGLVVAVGLLFTASFLPKTLERNADAARVRRAEAQELMTVARRGRGKTRTPENQCIHCAGSGECGDCSGECRVCSATGMQPNNPVLLNRLNKLWNGP